MPKHAERAPEIEARKSLVRIQEFDCAQLVRKEELGRDLNFGDAVAPAERIIALFRQIAPDVLGDFPDSRLNALKGAADGEFNRLDQILKFSATAGNPKAQRDTLVAQLQSAYDTLFENIWPLVAYSVRRATDFARLEREARGAVQATLDEVESVKSTLESNRRDAQQALEAIRKVAAEQGVSQQAIYFKEESDAHSGEAERWLTRTTSLTALLGLLAIGSLFLHKIPYLAPQSLFEAIQLVLAKVLAFGTFASYLFLASRNYLAHRHNTVVNKHRQNSLVTYRALVEAAGEQANRDLVVARVAESIFGFQPTGFIRPDGVAEGGSLRPVVSVNPALVKTSTGAGTG